MFKKDNEEYKKWFDEKFFKGGGIKSGEVGEKGGIRTGTPENLGVLFGVAQAIAKTFPNMKELKVYEAGAGIGWLSRFMKDNGFKNITSSDISDWASEHSKEVSGMKVYQADVRELKNKEKENSFDLVVSWNVLAYLPEEDIEFALHNLRYLTCDYLLLSIVTDKVLQKRSHGIIGRRTIRSRDWWYKKFEDTGFIVDYEKEKEFCACFGEPPEETGAFILRKKFYTHMEDSDENPTVKKDAEFYVNTIGVKSFVEVGCGYGYTVKEARKLGANAIGIEICRDVIEKSPNKDFIIYGKSNDIPLEDNSVDWVVTKSVMEHIYNEEDTIAEFARVAKEGVYALICLEKRNDPTHVNIKTRQEWIDTFKKYGFIKISNYFNLSKLSEKQREEIFIFKKVDITAPSEDVG